MATINLGRIKPVNKGTWSNSTAYAIDDFVQYTDNGVLSTYIAVATSTNQTPSTSGTVNSTYWKFMAKGANVSVGNNKIVTSDGSGNLTWGTAGGGAHTIQEWTTQSQSTDPSITAGTNAISFGTEATFECLSSLIDTTV